MAKEKPLVVHIRDPWDVARRCKQWGCTQDELKAAVKATGTYLKSKGPKAHVNERPTYTLRPTDLGSPKDDFVFRFNGRDVGRTYANATPNGPRWYWSIYGINLRGPLPEGRGGAGSCR